MQGASIFFCSCNPVIFSSRVIAARDSAVARGILHIPRRKEIFHGDLMTIGAGSMLTGRRVNDSNAGLYFSIAWGGDIPSRGATRARLLTKYAATSAAMLTYSSSATPFPSSMNGWWVVRWNEMLDGGTTVSLKGMAEDDASAMKIRRFSTNYARRASRVALSCQLP